MVTCAYQSKLLYQLSRQQKYTEKEFHIIQYIQVAKVLSSFLFPCKVILEEVFDC